MVIGLFWAALSPGRIRSLIEFRLSMAVLVLALLAPSAIQIFLVLTQNNAGTGMGMTRPPATSSMQTMVYTSAIPPFLVAIAMYLGINSILPAGTEKPQPRE